MWFRSAAVASLVLAVVGLTSGQQAKVYSRAVPPEKAVLDRLNLKTEWTLYLPVEGRRDSIELVQTFDDQLFVQTRTGLIIAVDARTGKIQWTASLGNGGYGNVYTVAVNPQFVFVAHVTKLYAFYRYTGVVEFTTDLGTPPTAGLTADNEAVYATLATRPGAAGVARIAAYELPRPIVLPDPARVAATKPSGKDEKVVNPVDELTKRYPVAGVSRTAPAPAYEDRAPSSLREAPVGGMAGSKTPSLTVATRLTPPYVREGTPPVQSLVTVPSLRPPYHMHDEASRDIQRTPSLSTIPPSIAASLALSDLRPRGIEPKLRWEYGMTSGVAFQLTQTSQRIWVVTEDRGFVALSKLEKTIQVKGTTFEQIAAAPAQAGATGYVPLGDGTLLAVDLATGNLTGGLNVFWKANAGGLLNRTPVITDDAVFAAGDNSGVVRIERATGEVSWRTDRAADRVVGLNQEFLYVQDRQGRQMVFDAKRANGAGGRTAPLSSIDLGAFNIPIVNTASDRLYFAADNGLLVCLRDASAKYAAPVRMAPDVQANPGGKTSVEGLKKDETPKKDEAPKKDETPKKDEPKK